jgi:ABC-2 type transport system permease protein
MQAVLAVMYREFLIRRTSPMWLFFDMLLPLLYLLMFGVALNKAMGAGMQAEGIHVSYTEFFIAGVLAMSAFGSATNQSYGFFIDRDNGIFYEFLTYPMTRGQFLFGKILFQCIMSVVQCGLTLLAGVYLLDVSVRWNSIPFVFAGMMIGTAGWFFLFASLAFLIRRNDTFNTVLNGCYFILIFLSSMFYPLDNVPTWLRLAAFANPLTWLTDGLRWLVIGVGDASFVVIEMALFVVFLFVSFWLALKALQKAV